VVFYCGLDLILSPHRRHSASQVLSHFVPPRGLLSNLAVAYHVANEVPLVAEGVLNELSGVLQSPFRSPALCHSDPIVLEEPQRDL
jgi:hypothetical protein